MTDEDGPEFGITNGVVLRAKLYVYVVRVVDGILLEVVIMASLRN